MIVLGIGGSTHEFSACLVIDGQVRVAIEEERLSRVKHHSLERLHPGQYRLRAVDYCLTSAGIELVDVDCVVANDLVYRGALRGLPKLETVDHHLSHAALVAYLSPHAPSAVLVMDGFGSIRDGLAQTVSYYRTDAARHLELVHRECGRVYRLSEDRPFGWSNYDLVEGSIGEFYSHVTRGIGFGLHEEGKTMGLAPYGTDRLVERFHDVVPVGPTGDIAFNRSTRRQLDDLIAAERGQPDNWKQRADLAAGAQAVLERCLIRRVQDLHDRTGLSDLAVSGGVFLNSVANRVLRETGPFETFYVHGATGDSGTAVGAALLAHHERTGVTPPPAPVLYTGRSYRPEEILAALAEVPEVRWDHRGDVVARAAAALARGEIVGWFQGGSEFGPRALGNRSLLADPSRPGMKDTINSVVKHREAFRPFAPAVLAERQEELLTTALPSPHMCINSHVHDAARSSLSAACHVDGSVRYQTVSSTSNPRFHALIAEFASRSGVPALLNTSFNDNEPIVESPGDALRCFLRAGVDCLVIDDFFVTRR